MSTNGSTTVPRRDFLKSLGTGGLLLAIGPVGLRRINDAELFAATLADPFNPVAFVKLADDGAVTIVCHRSEMGQGIRTTMPMIIADEMEADWARCRVEQADGDEKRYGSQNTDGSTSIRNNLSRYREAGATVRALMEDAAAKEWNVAASEVQATQHTVVHTASGRTLGYGALVATARTLPMPAKERLRIKAPAERRMQGKKVTSIDLVAMTTGKGVYGADVRLPDMLTAVIARPPVYGGKVVSFDATAAMRIKGVKKIVKIPEAAVPAGYNPVGGIAVLATNTWAAMEGRKALKIKWDHGTNASYDSDVYRVELAANVKKPGKPGRQQGDVTAALASAAKKIAADYYVPHLSHAQMEPVAAVASFRNGAVEAWAPSQSPQTARDTIAAYLKLPAEQVTVHVTLLGGGFGRKSKPDFIVEAAYLSREAGVPVRVQWTREDDLKNSYYHTVAAHHLEAGLDGDGAVKAWLHRCAYPPIGSTFAPDVAGPSPGELTNGASDLPYAIPNLSIEVCPAPTHTRIGWYRSVNAIHHGFAIGSFLDELAHASGKDPKSFLLDLLGPDRQMDLTKEGAVGRVSNYGARWTDHPIDTGRIRRVLELVAEKSDWGSPLPKGRGRGIAVHGSFLSYVAVVVEAEVAADGSVRVPRATMAVDAGFIANPDRARSQMEGALIMGMSNALYSEISFKDGRVAQSNYSDYRVTRMNAAPRAISVHLVESEGLPGGIGEPGVPPVAPALANAIYSATGTRIRRLPVGNQLAASRRTASAGG